MRACFLAEAEWPEAIPQVRVIEPLPSRCSGGVFVSGPRGAAEEETKEIVEYPGGEGAEFFVEKRAVRSVPLDAALSVVMRVDTSPKSRPHGTVAARTVEASSQRASRRGFGSQKDFALRLIQSRLFPDIRFCRAGGEEVCYFDC